MWPKLHSSDFKVIGHYLGTITTFLGIVMLIPGVMALLMQCTDVACDFFIGVGFCLLVGSVLRFLVIKPSRITRQQALILTGIAWIWLSLFAAIPLYLSGDYTLAGDSVFDTLSMMTTTGTSIITDLDHSALPFQLWRIILCIIGGQLVILVALTLGFFGRTGGAGAVYGVYGEDESQVLPDLYGMARIIVAVSGTMLLVGTAIGALICCGLGIPLLQAIYYGFSLVAAAYNTAGITPHSGSLVYFHSWEIELFCVVFALIAALNFVFYTGLRNRKGLMTRSTETKTLALWMIAGVVVVAFVMCRDTAFGGFDEVMRRGTFNVIFASTTTGLQTVYPQQMGTTLSADVLTIMMLVAIVGGSSGSTAGGIKALRLGLIWKWVVATVKKSLRPGTSVASPNYFHYTKQRLTSSTATLAMMMFILYAFTAVIGGVIGIAYGYDAVPALYQSVAAVSNGGVDTGIISESMPLGLKITYSVEMYLGRLEFIALLSMVVGVIISLVPRKKVHRPKDAKNNKGKSVVACIVALVLAVAVGVAPVAAQATVYGRGNVSSPYAATPGEESLTIKESSVLELLGSAASADGTWVSFSAEAVGEPIHGVEGTSWVNVADKGSSIGVVMPQEDIALIKHWGAYGVKGSELRIIGTLHTACDSHGGELDVHAELMAVISPGGAYTVETSASKIQLAAGFCLAGAAVWVGYLVRRRRSR